MTDVHFHERNEFGATQTLDRGVLAQRTEMTTISNTANLEATEMAAFEKGRMQGEMEAIRRMEAEQGAMQLKQFPAEPVATVQKPDVVEINRLTWLQRLSWLTGEGALIASIVLTIVWIELYRGSFAWSTDTGAVGNIGMWNTHLLSFVLGIFFLAQAITMYRVLPLNLSPWVNRAIYVFNYCCAMTCFSITFAARVNTPPEATFWAVDDWCYALAFSVVGLHFIYSMIRTFMVRARPVDYETWSETNNKVTMDTPEQRRDHSTFNHAGRTVYTPAPVTLARISKNMPAASANVGAQVPVAPGNAPRWAENPNTHAEDYFLLPRAKWATVGYFAIGAVFLMTLAAVQHNLAAGTQNWSQNNVENPPRFMNERGNEAAILGALSLLLLSGLIFIAYAAMPPRTTLVKNGILTDANRRTSISHNAETVNERHIV